MGSAGKIVAMELNTFFIDLDETVYPVESGIWAAVGTKMGQYMHDVLGLGWEEIPRIREGLYHQYGTTTRGLQVIYHIDVDAFLEYVHDLPIQELLSPDPELGAVLRQYPQRKVIFTNATRKHAERVLAALGIMDCFDEIVDIYAFQPFCKPQEEAYQVALRAAGEKDPRKCLFVDDTAKNIVPARAMGFLTVRVGAACEQAHYSIAKLANLPDVLPLQALVTSLERGE